MRYLYMRSDVYARMEQEWNAIRQGGEMRLPLLHSPDEAGAALPAGRGKLEDAGGGGGSPGTGS